MAKELTLQRIQQEIEDGNLGKARDRLHGLISTYPEDFDLREQLGNVYQALQHPQMAGCYWFLVERPTSEMWESIHAFREWCGRDPWLTWHRVKYRGRPDALPDEAKYRLDQLAEECEDVLGYYPVYREGKKEIVLPQQQEGETSSCLPLFLLIVGTIFLLAIFGLVTLLRWLIQVVF